jgi:outer membrane murein-binding lipoprotein Lpp
MRNIAIFAVVLSTMVLTGCQQELPPVTATVTGNAPAGSTVKATVGKHSYSVKTGAFGSYKIAAEAPQGASDVIVEITDPQGNSSSTTRKIVAGVSKPDPKVTLNNGYAVSPEEAVMAEIRDLAEITGKKVDAILPVVSEVRNSTNEIKTALGSIAKTQEAQTQILSILATSAKTQVHTTVHPVGVTPAPVAAPKK